MLDISPFPFLLAKDCRVEVDEPTEELAYELPSRDIRRCDGPADDCVFFRCEIYHMPVNALVAHGVRRPELLQHACHPLSTMRVGRYGQVTEKSIEKYLVVCTERVGGMCIKLVPDYCTGLPDRLLLLPHGRVVFVELKRGRQGRLSRRQAVWLSRLRKLGFEAAVVRTREEAFTIVHGLPCPGVEADARAGQSRPETQEDRK